MFNKLKKKYEKDKLKSITVIIATLVFIISIVMVAINSGDSYALSISDYTCSTSGYDVVSGGDGNYYCCPAGWTYNTTLKQCYYKTTVDAGSIEQVCSMYSSSYGYDQSNGIWYCNKNALTPTRKNFCYYCVNGSEAAGGEYVWGNLDNPYCDVKSSYSSEASCLAQNESCYYCVNGSVDAGGEYVWGTRNDYGNVPYCDVKSSYSNKGSCLAQNNKDVEPETPVTYKISYNANGGSGAPADQIKTQGVDLILSSIEPVRKGYTFLGWSSFPDAIGATYTAGDTFMSDGNYTLYAVWEAKSYIVTYNGNGGLYDGSETYQDLARPVYGEDYIVYSNDHFFVREGYTFTGWKDQDGNTWNSGYVNWQYDKNITLYAQWKAKTYNVSYDANGGSGAPSNQSKTHGTDLTLSSTEPVWEGHTFLGWATSSTATSATYGAGGTYSSDSDATLFAVWKINTYTVTYDANGGSGAPSNQTKTHGTDLTLRSTEPVWEGHTFLGWAISSTATSVKYGAGAKYTTNASVTLYAVWKSDTTGDIVTPENPTSYTIKYDANGGSGAPSNQDGTTITISSSIPKREGYTFVSWNTEKNGSGTSYKAGDKYAGNEDATLYAQWKINTYKIDYKLSGGSISGNPNTGTYNSTITIKNPTKTVTIVGNDNKTSATIGDDVTVEFKFAGWTSSTINTSTAYYGDTAWTDGNTKVTATEFKNLTITDGATVTLIANWDDSTTTLPSVSKEGYTCRWNTKSDGKGDSYVSGGKYIVSSDSQSVNLYAICDTNSKADNDVDKSPKTGIGLIYTVWIIGVGALGYSVYYFMKRKSNI